MSRRGCTVIIVRIGSFQILVTGVNGAEELTRQGYSEI